MSEMIKASIDRLNHWIRGSDWVGYDPFDGLSAPLAKSRVFRIPILRIAIQQSVRRFPVNLRPLLGITKKHSTKAMGYFASGYLRLYRLTHQQEYLDNAIFCLSDLQENYSQGYSGYAWGNAFDYQSRGNYLPRNVPTIVWTSFIGYAFMDAYELLGDQAYLEVARSACEFILRDLSTRRITNGSLCISYVPHEFMGIHNSNMLGASLLARVYQYTDEPELIDIAHQAVRYTMNHQREDGSWYYGEGLRWHWVDGYHTGFVLDALYWYMQSTGDDQYEGHLQKGMNYYRSQLFADVQPKHYHSQTYPIDIQAVAQAIQTFALISETHCGDLDWSEQIACWAISHMQDPSGYFYFRRHRFVTDKTPFLHWGQATMLASLALVLLRRHSLLERARPAEVMEGMI